MIVLSDEGYALLCVALRGVQRVVEGAESIIEADDLPTAEELAKLFHDTYERLAPSFGYATRKESAVSWNEVPEINRELMIAVCAEILKRFDGKGAS